VLPPTLFFFVGFHLILFTRWMTLQGTASVHNFFGATLRLLVGRRLAVSTPPLHRFDGAPLIQPILFKSAIYWVCVFVFRIAEGAFHFLHDGGALEAFPDLAAEFSWPRFWRSDLADGAVPRLRDRARLNTLFGDGERRDCSCAGTRRKPSSRGASGSACSRDSTS
jgi:hypothetical protein